MLKMIFSLSLIASLTALLFFLNFHHAAAPVIKQLVVETPLEKQKISAKGSLKIRGQVKIGSMVAGRVRAIHVQENDRVMEGQLLIDIDTGLEDTEVREAEGAYERALAELEYQEANYHRQSQLFSEKFISGATLEDALRGYKTAQADAKALKASYEKKLLAYRDTKIYAPTSGIILHVDVEKGEKVTADLDGGTLLSLAPDVAHIEANIEIHEKDIGQVKIGQPVQLVVDAYPSQVFQSSIQAVSFIPIAEKESEPHYQAKAVLDNSQRLLQPGMTIRATIEAANTNAGNNQVNFEATAGGQGNKQGIVPEIEEDLNKLP